MRVTTFILLALTFLHSTPCFSKNKIEWDCTKANAECQKYVPKTTNYCQEIPPASDGKPTHIICLYGVTGVCVPQLIWYCDQIIVPDPCPTDDPPTDGWWTLGSANTDGSYCDGKCRITPDPVPGGGGNPQGANSDGVTAEHVKGKKSGAICDPLDGSKPIPGFKPEPGCPLPYGPGTCDGYSTEPTAQYMCLEITGPDGQPCMHIQDSKGCDKSPPDPECIPAEPNDPGPDDSFPDNPDTPTDPNNPNPTDPANPTDPNNPGGGGGGTLPGGAGGTGGTDNSGLKGKDPDKDGNCDMGYIPRVCRQIQEVEYLVE